MEPKIIVLSLTNIKNTLADVKVNGKDNCGRMYIVLDQLEKLITDIQNDGGKAQAAEE